MQALRLHQVEIAAADLARGDGPGELEDRIIGVHDQGDLAPFRDVLHGGGKMFAARHAHHGRRQRLDHRARRDAALARNVLDHGAGIVRHMRPEIGKIGAQHIHLLDQPPQAAALALPSVMMTSKPSNLGWPR